jgi:hypothetical protein
MAVPNIFGSATSAIPLSQLDQNFATAITLGNTAVYLGNTTTSLGNVTLTNVTISSGNVSVSTATVGAGSNTAPSITTTGDTNTGIFFPAADTIAFSEGGVESARFDSAGNFGLGSTPTSQDSTYKAINLSSLSFFSVAGHGAAACEGNLLWNAKSSGNETFTYTNTGDFASRFRQNKEFQWLIAPSGTAGNTISFTQAMTLDADGNLGVGTSSPSTAGGSYTGLDIRGSGGGSIRYGVASGFNMLTYATGSTVDFLTSAAGDIRFFNKTSSGESMRIDSSGNLLVRCTSAGFVNDDGTSIEPGAIVQRHINGTASGTGYTFFIYNGSMIGSIIQSGTSAVTYNTSSDYRLKNTIAPMTGALDKVALLKPCTYKWNVDGSDGQGFIAHELAEVAPYAVSGEKDGEQMQGVDYGKLTPILTAALQEAIAKIETLEARIAVLEAK